VTETAEVLQVAEGTVKSRLSRALDRLRIIQQDFPVLAEGHEGHGMTELQQTPENS
jgi:hypothetical protein